MSSPEAGAALQGMNAPEEKDAGGPDRGHVEKDKDAPEEKDAGAPDGGHVGEDTDAPEEGQQEKGKATEGDNVALRETGTSPVVAVGRGTSDNLGGKRKEDSPPGAPIQAGKPGPSGTGRGLGGSPGRKRKREDVRQMLVAKRRLPTANPGPEPQHEGDSESEDRLPKAKRQRKPIPIFPEYDSGSGTDTSNEGKTRKNEIDMDEDDGEESDYKPPEKGYSSDPTGRLYLSDSDDSESSDDMFASTQEKIKKKIFFAARKKLKGTSSALASGTATKGQKDRNEPQPGTSSQPPPSTKTGKKGLSRVLPMAELLRRLGGKPTGSGEKKGSPRSLAEVKENMLEASRANKESTESPRAKEDNDSGTL